MDNLEDIVRGLTSEDRAALVPLTCFSDAVGAKMIRLGLMTEHDGVWNHTKLGERARILSSCGEG